MAAREKVLFLCTGNSCRSQMAEGWLRHLAGGRFEVFSAGTHPLGLHPAAVRVMGEVGVDLTGHTSDAADDYADVDFDLVVTVCDAAAAACPTWAGARRRAHWPFEDPALPAGQAEALEGLRGVRDAIRGRVQRWLDEGTPELGG